MTTAQGTTHFEYDALDRLTKVTDRLNGETTYAYDATKGVLDAVTYGNATKTGNALLASFECTLGLTGRRHAVHEEVDDGKLHTSDVTYGYDDLDRLLAESRSGWPQPYTLGFEYDDVGNRTKQTRGGVATHYAYDVRDRFECENDAIGCATPAVAYGWDASGRMTSRGTAETFTWDPEDRLLSHVGGSTTTSFAYDMDGIRYRKQSGSDPATEYLVDANRQYQEVLEEWTDDTTPTLAMEYALGPSILWQRTGAGEQRWFHGDAQMSTRILTSPTPSVESKLTYEAFGSDVAPPSTMPTSYRYTGQQADRATEGSYLRARYTVANLGRFVAADAVDGLDWEPRSLNRYVYAEGDPVNLVDPSGEFAESMSLPGLLSVTSIIGLLGSLAVAAVAACAGSMVTSIALSGIGADPPETMCSTDPFDHITLYRGLRRKGLNPGAFQFNPDLSMSEVPLPGYDLQLPIRVKYRKPKIDGVKGVVVAPIIIEPFVYAEYSPSGRNPFHWSMWPKFMVNEDAAQKALSAAAKALR